MRVLFEYLKLSQDFFLLRKDRPYIVGLVITDICNLNCKHCRVANIYRKHMSYEEIERHMTRYYSQGARFLYIEGGEPYLWHDNRRRLLDIVRLAKDIGYLRVHIYTNEPFRSMPAQILPGSAWMACRKLIPLLGAFPYTRF